MRRFTYLCVTILMLLGGYGELKAQEEYQVRIVEGCVKMRNGKEWIDLKQGAEVTKSTVLNIGKGAKLTLMDKALPDQKTETPREYCFCEPGTLSVERLITKTTTSVRSLSRTLFSYYKKLLANGGSTQKRGMGEDYTTVVRDADSLLSDVDSLAVTAKDSIIVVPNDTVAAP
ncbi:MAG: hypothetical protein K2J96_01555 [Bacteroidaceae bacterium]|nr:hypothetical protein [Bacteroidaceae bacterium]